MSHNLEIVDGKARMAYTKRTEADVPWHGLGEPVDPGMSPLEMLEVSGNNFSLVKVPLYGIYKDKLIEADRQALIRAEDSKVLTVISNDWEPVPNIEAAEFFHEWTDVGDMEMDTMGSLQEGRIFWALAKTSEAFEVFKDDPVRGYMLLVSPHIYGRSLVAKHTGIRVVCNNTLDLALSKKSKHELRLDHRAKFNQEEVKKALNINRAQMAKFKEMAEVLAKHRYKKSQLVDYFKDVLGTKGEDGEEMSRRAQTAFDIMETQPGADKGRGTWWQPVNAVTYAIDHKLGRSADTRLNSAWFGVNRGRKIVALEKALEYAMAA